MYPNNEILIMSNCGVVTKMCTELYTNSKERSFIECSDFL